MSMADLGAIRRLIATIEENVAGSGEGLRNVTVLALAVIFIYIARALSRFGTNYVAHYAAWNILENIRSELYDHIQKLSLKYFNDKHTGELMSRVINDTPKFRAAFGSRRPH